MLFVGPKSIPLLIHIDMTLIHLMIIYKEKCDRTIELCLKYDERARIAEYQYFKSDEAEDAEELGMDVDVVALSAKLRGGGDIFHRLCAILSFVCVGSTRSHGHVREQLKLQGASISGEFEVMIYAVLFALYQLIIRSIHQQSLKKALLSLLHC